MKTLLLLLSALSLLIPVSTVSASVEGNGTFQVTDKCVGDEIVPCVDDDGTIMYYCNDPRSDNIKGCFPSGNPVEDLAMAQKQLEPENQSQSQSICDSDSSTPAISCDKFGNYLETLPSCESVFFYQKCMSAEGPVLDCEDPEFNFETYPQGCIDTSDPDPEDYDNNNTFSNLTAFNTTTIDG